MSDRRLEQLHFHCSRCGESFQAVPAVVQDDPDYPWHPFRYLAPCAVCGNEEARQASWERALWKAWATSTGPKTPEGKERSQANIAKANAPENHLRTRFNAMKHGLFAKTAQYYPAKPGKYPHCANCEHLNNGCNEKRIENHRNPPACLKRVELFMDFSMAFESRDPSLLTKYHANLQAMMTQVINDMIMQVIADGVSWKTPEWSFDKEGTLRLAEFTDRNGEYQIIQKVEAHPLLKFLIEFMNRNGMTLPDSGMTMKVKDDNENVRGFLDAQAADQESSAEFRERQTRALEGLAALVQRSQAKQSRDPVLLEHQADDAESEGEA